MSEIPTTAEKLRDEFRRIASPTDGAFNDSHLTGLGFSSEEVLRALRETPDRAGLAAFFRRLDALLPPEDDPDDFDEDLRDYG